MVQSNIPKWANEVEAILSKKYSQPDITWQLAKVKELFALVEEVEIPSGDTGQVVAQILKLASEELQPLGAVYAGYQLGVAYEKYHNTQR